MTPRVRVGDVLQLQRRAVQVDPAAEYEEIGIRSFGKGIFHKEPVSGVDLGNKRVFRIEPGDLVLSNVFAWEGGIAVASDRESGKIGSHRFMTFTSTDGRIDPAWAAWFFLSEPGLELIGKASPGSAGRNRTLAVERFEDLEIPLPLIDEQRSIASQLDHSAATVSQAVFLASRAKEISGALRSALSSTNSKAVPIGDLVSSVRRPVVLDPSESYRMLGCRWYGEGLFVREIKSGAAIAATTLYTVGTGDLVYNRLFAWKGSFALAGQELSGAVVSGEFPTFLIDGGRVVPEYLLSALASPEFLDEVDRRSAGGTPTSRNRLKEKEFLQIKIPLPDLEAQQRIAGLVQVVKQAERHRTRFGEIAEALVPAALNAAFSEFS